MGRYCIISTFSLVRDKRDLGNYTNLPHGRKSLLTGGQTDSPLWPAQKPTVHIKGQKKYACDTSTNGNTGIKYFRKGEMKNIFSKPHISAGARLTMQAVLQMSAGVS